MVKRRTPTEMKTECPICKRFFDDEPMLLITCAFVDGVYNVMCPLCYAEKHLVMHGVCWEPVGEVTSYMFELAKKQYPKWEKENANGKG